MQTVTRLKQTSDDKLIKIIPVSQLICSWCCAIDFFRIFHSTVILQGINVDALSWKLIYENAKKNYMENMLITMQVFKPWFVKLPCTCRFWTGPTIASAMLWFQKYFQNNQQLNCMATIIWKSNNHYLEIYRTMLEL